MRGDPLEPRVLGRCSLYPSEDGTLVDNSLSILYVDGAHADTLLAYIEC